MSVAALKLGDALKLLHRCMEEGGSITWGHHFKKALEDAGRRKSNLSRCVAGSSPWAHLHPSRTGYQDR
jgi:hypothetical protein